MLIFIHFVHVIAAMVFFGLPFCFGRWYRVVAAGGDRETLLQTLTKLRFFCLLHLNLSGGLALLTGILLASRLGLWSQQGWVHLAPLLTLAALANVNLVLQPGLKRALRAVEMQGEPALKTRLALFSACHHTTVTLLTFLMIAKPF